LSRLSGRRTNGTAVWMLNEMGADPVGGRELEALGGLQRAAEELAGILAIFRFLPFQELFIPRKRHEPAGAQAGRLGGGSQSLGAAAVSSRWGPT